MSIEFHFSSPDIVGDSIAEKDELNKEIAEKTLDKFGDEYETLKKQNILIFFDWWSTIRDKDKLGSLIIKDTPSYQSSINYYPALSRVISKFSDFEFIVYVTRKVRERDNKIFKVLTIAHELKHLIQVINFRDIYYQSSTLKAYFWMESKFKNELNELYRKMPIEVDAFRKAKLIAMKISGKSGVDNFIKKEIENAPSEIDKGYWNNIKDLDVGRSFDLQKEAQKFWDKYEDELYSKKDELEKKSKFCELDIKEKKFLEAFEFYLRNKKI